MTLSSYASKKKRNVSALSVAVLCVLILDMMSLSAEAPSWKIYVHLVGIVFCGFFWIMRSRYIWNEDATDMLRSGVWREKFYQMYDQLLTRINTTSVLTTWHVYSVRHVDGGVYVDMRNTVNNKFTTLFIMYSDAYEEYLNGIFLEEMEAPPKGTHCWDAYVEIFNKILKKVEDQPRDAVHMVSWGLFECGMSTVSFGENWKYERGVCITGEILVGNKSFELIPMKLVCGAIEILKT